MEVAEVNDGVDEWAFLAPSWRVLREHGLSLPIERVPGSLCPKFRGLRIVSPLSDFQRVRDALELVFVQSIVDRAAFKRLALAHCEQLETVVDPARATFSASELNEIPCHVEISFVEPVTRRSVVGTPALLLPMLETFCMANPPQGREPSFCEALQQLLQTISDDAAMVDAYGRLAVTMSVEVEGIDTFRTLIDTAGALHRSRQSGSPHTGYSSLFRWSRITLVTRYFPSIHLTAPTPDEDLSWVLENEFSTFFASSRWREQVSKQCLVLQNSSCVENLRVACSDDIYPPVPPQFMVWLVHAIFSSSSSSIHTVLLDSFAIDEESLDELRRHIAATFPIQRLEELRIDHADQELNEMAVYRLFRYQSHNVRSLDICSRDGQGTPVSRAQMLREFLQLVGEPLEELALSDSDAPLEFEPIVARCPQLRTLKLRSSGMPAYSELINLYESGNCSVSNLELIHLHGSSTTEFMALLTALVDPTLRISQVVRELSLSLDARNVESGSLLTLEKLIERLVRTNVTLTFLQLTLPENLYTRLRPIFLSLDNTWLAGIRIPVPLRAKRAFISVVNETLIVPGKPIPAIACLDEAMMANILMLAGHPVRRRLVLTTF